MKKSITSLLALLSAASFALAETWAYDPVNPENNSRAGFVINDADYVIDVSAGTLTVTSGSLENKGASTIFKGANTSSGYADYSLDIKGNYVQQHGNLVLQNITLTTNPIYNENANSVMSVQGKVKINASETKNGAV